MGHLRSKNANLVNVSKHQKVQSCFSFFALKKSFWRIIALQKIFCQKWLFFLGLSKKTKYFGSHNSSNHLSEVAVEKKALWFSICFLKIRNFLSRPFDFNWDSLWFYLAQLGREIRFGSLEIMKYEKHALRLTIKGEGKERKTIGGKSIYFYDWMQLRRQRFWVIFLLSFKQTRINSRQPTNFGCIAFFFKFFF